MLDDDPRIDRAGQTATSYGGTYRFRGDRVEHVVDICDDPAFLGIVVTREVSRGEGRVHYTMMNGASSECVRWEKVGDVAIDDQTA